MHAELNGIQKDLIQVFPFGGAILCVVFQWILLTTVQLICMNNFKGHCLIFKSIQ